MGLQTERLGAASVDPAAWDFYVFRKSRETFSVRRLLEELRTEVAAGLATHGIDALVRAGEIESGLADAESPLADRVASIVDDLAAAVCGTNAPTESLATRLALPLLLKIALLLKDQSDTPLAIRCAHPEGFSYYGLNPLDFADLIARIHPELRSHVAVIGIRSVGPTLSAVVAAALRGRGSTAERITVRPQGEPYARTTVFLSEQVRWIQNALSANGDFVVVDEGPGFSGSTFVSVARALEAAGVPQSRIILLCSRPFPARCPRSEWACYRAHCVEYGRRIPATAGQNIGAGVWRELSYAARKSWPACWTDQERIKHLSADHNTLLKFEGFGRYGQLVRNQAATLAEARFSPFVVSTEGGYASYSVVDGRPLSRGDLNKVLLGRMAAYCAFRAKEFPAYNPNVGMLSEMLHLNLRVEFGFDGLSLEIPLERPTYPDCRMLPHEWVQSPNGEFLKTDSASHGDGHQFPGPTDIAWDLAGTIVEWDMTPEAAEYFLVNYRQKSGDDPSRRLPAYLLLYSALRMAQCRMARAATSATYDSHLFHRQYLRLKSFVKVLLKRT